MTNDNTKTIINCQLRSCLTSYQIYVNMNSKSFIATPKFIINTLKKQGMRVVEKIQNKEYWEALQEDVRDLNIEKTEAKDWVPSKRAAILSGLTLARIQNEIESGNIAIHPTLKSYKGKSLVYLPHALKIGKAKKLFEEAKESKIIQDFKIGDINKYLLADVQKQSAEETLNQTQINYLWKLFNDYFSEEYDLVLKKKN